MGQVFLKRGESYSPTEGNFIVTDTLDEGIYAFNYHPLTGGVIGFQKVGDKFHFGFKLYGIDNTLIDHVINTYNRQEVRHNIGVLLTGAKGTGKTVTAKVLANNLGLPVFIVDRPCAGLNEFIINMKQDCVFFFDEFEKTFGNDENKKSAGESLLTLMDGVYTTNTSHIFVLTTNNLNVNENLLSRPSRIRYLKSFGEVISRDILEEYVKDNLKYMEFFDDIMDYIDSLTMATIDIVKTIVDEVNINKCPISEFKDFFNVSEASYFYSVRRWSFSDGNVRRPCFAIRVSGQRKDSEETDNVVDYSSKEWFLGQIHSNPERDVPSYGSFTLQKPITKYKEGDNIGSQYVIDEIDLSNQYILLSDETYPSDKFHIYINDINAKPSVYKADARNNGRNDYLSF